MKSAVLHPVMSCGEARVFETKYFAGDVAGERVAAAMRRVAEGVARECRALMAEADTGRDRLAVVLAGKGRNGGDALLAAALLLTDCAGCVVLLAAAESDLVPETRAALEGLRRAGGERVETILWEAGCVTFSAARALVIDGLTGSGFRAPLRPEMRSLILAANALPDALRVAVDLPSGAGDESDATLFEAHLTVAAGILKTPLFEDAVSAAAGRIRYADAGFFDGAGEAGGRSVVSSAIFAPLRAPRPSRSDKRTFGRVLAVAGSDDMPGAAMLNARSALRSGAGLVTVACPASVQPAFVAALPEAMWLAVATHDDGGLRPEELPRILEKAKRADALTLGSGCGPSPETQKLLSALVARFEGRVVIDADALRPEVVAAVRRRPAGAAPVVLTPHAGEFERLAGAPPSGEALDAYAKKTGAIVVMKGAGTFVSDGTRRAFIPHGGPVLARGGSGDLLAGMLVSLLSREKGDVFETVCRAVAWQGRAADVVAAERGAHCLLTGEVLDGLRAATAE